MRLVTQADWRGQDEAKTTERKVQEFPEPTGK